jgi:serine-type D-Ala-D-Ala carboxypeptidase
VTSLDFALPRKLVTVALAESLFPGAVVFVQLRGETVWHEAFGKVGGESGHDVTADTLFDLASLTKVLCTTPVWMILESRDPGFIDRPLDRWFPEEASSDKAGITPRLLLAHASGLPAWWPYYLFESGERDMRKLVIGKIMSAPLVYRTGEGTIYSDLGFVLLWVLAEQETGRPMDEFADREVFAPLGVAGELLFRPSGGNRSIALTRPGDPPGLVHDLNSRTLGGVSGHAGLFGTARGVGRLACEILTEFRDRPGLFDSKTLRMFCRRAGFTADSTRALGFDTPSATDSSGGRYLSRTSLGHTGFTGTSLWIDIEKEVIVVLLTNRVFMGEADIRIKGFRPIFHDRVMEGLGFA